MDERSKRSPHIYIVGQTASGKSSFALDCAKELELEILNTDSLLFYEGLDIGTAKPTKKEQEEVKHHFIDTNDLGEELTASDYEKKASQILESKGQSFLCVGGSGFYINALDIGLLPLPQTDLQVKKEVMEVDDPVGLLKEVDPEILKTMSENDLYRVRRALEVYKQTGKPLSVWKKEFNPMPFAKKIAFQFSREELLERVKKRTKQMLSNGLIEETQRIYEKTGENWKPLQSIGYKQCLMFLKNELSSDAELEELIITRTMQLAKRQKTWFKGDSSVDWFEYSDMKKAKEYIKIAFEDNQWKV